MAVVGVMRCPANHAANDWAEEVAFIREWAAATSWDSIRESLLAEGHCPACPGTERLQPGTTVRSAATQHAALPMLRRGVDHRLRARLDVPRHRKADSERTQPDYLTGVVIEIKEETGGSSRRSPRDARWHSA